uniref:US10_2 n=1 Tax=Human herpesvirus 1 TaxID=10298 RepID=A0A2U9A4S9_HHV1|nr:US10_2 [Human alphaherpesvirus 1]
MIKRRGNVEIRVYYESVRTLRSRSHLKPSDRQQSPGHRVFPGSPGFRDHPENLGNPEYRELPETPGYRVTPGIHDNPGGAPASPGAPDPTHPPRTTYGSRVCIARASMPPWRAQTPSPHKMQRTLGPASGSTPRLAFRPPEAQPTRTCGTTRAMSQPRMTQGSTLWTPGRLRTW